MHEFIEQAKTCEGGKLQSKLSQFHQKESSTNVPILLSRHDEVQGLIGSKNIQNIEKNSTSSFIARDNHF